MIVDKIENYHLYAKLLPGFARAFELLRNPQVADQPDGKYEIDNENFYICQHYQSKPLEQGKLEAHRKYIDIQFIADGCEMMGYSNLENLQIDKPYDSDPDIAFYNTPDKISMIELCKDMFCILYPHDAHMPGLNLDGSSTVHKIVVKVKADA